MKMKQVFYLITLLLTVSAAAVHPAVRPAAPAVDAESFILTDAGTGQILCSKNLYTRRPVASTTKIMTAMVVLENTDPDDIVTASSSVTDVPSTSLHLKPGEQVKVKDLLAALLIRSANDAAVALAEHVGGTVEGFAQMMNDTAKELGAKNTHFKNPNGLYVPGHYSTAYDLALIARHALRIPLFNELVATQSARIERSVNQEDVLVQTRSKFLKHYDGADGVKSGYTKQSGYCYVGSATRGGWRLLAVVLKSEDSQAATAALMDHGFKNFRRVVLGVPDQPVAKVPVIGGASELDVVPSQKLHVAVRAGHAESAGTRIHVADIHAPVRKGDKVGTMTAYVGARRIATVELEAAHDVAESAVAAAWPWVRSIMLLCMLSIGVACGRAAAKGAGGGRGWLA